MKTKNYTRSYRSVIRNIPERYLLQKISSLSKEMYKKADLTYQLMKQSQREYYLQELVRRDEKTLS